MGTLETTYEADKRLPQKQRDDLAVMLKADSDGEPLNFDDARTMQGYEQALKGEGYSVAEVDAFFQKKFDALNAKNA